VTYKGHTEDITCARFSPDGAWCATSGKDGVLTLWDLRMKEVSPNHGMDKSTKQQHGVIADGQSCYWFPKVLHKFQVPKSAIQTFEFHPTELIVAAATSERVVRFWDSEKFELLAITNPEPHPVSSLRCGPLNS